MKRYVIGILSVAVVGMAGAAFAQTPPQPMPQDYQILARKSIFSRDRMVADPNNRRNLPRDRNPQPKRNFTPVFIGVLLEDNGEFVAYVQEPQSGAVTGYHAGDALPGTASVIRTIDLDAMSVTGADKQSKKIAIGQNVLGGEAEYPSAAPPPAPPAPSAPGTAAGPPPEGGPNGGPGDNPGDNGGAAAAPPSAGGPPAAGGPSGRLPGESMIDYFKRRRAMQLNKQ